jgi:SM-20-related protein
MNHPVVDPARLQSIADAIAGPGWCVVKDFLPAAAVEALAEECLQFHRDGRLKRAGIGKTGELQVRDDIRGDHILWFNDAEATPAQRIYLDALEELRQTMNRELALGLFEYEGHYALYPPGTFYQKHLDPFRGVEARTLTAVFYLNRGWTAEDGGQLRFFLNGESDEEFVDIPPEAGTLACFLSSRFWHEVLPARRERMAVTGWFRRRG